MTKGGIEAVSWNTELDLGWTWMLLPQGNNTLNHSLYNVNITFGFKLFLNYTF